MPPPEATLRPLPSHRTGLPRLPEPPFRRAAPTTPADRAGAHVDCFPRSRGLPQKSGGSASALSLSRPAQASLTLRPAGSLSRPQATFVTRLRPMRLPTRAARQLPDQSTTNGMDRPCSRWGKVALPNHREPTKGTSHDQRCEDQNCCDDWHRCRQDHLPNLRHERMWRGRPTADSDSSWPICRRA
jgi:hypothetical protein